MAAARRQGGGKVLRLNWQGNTRARRARANARALAAGWASLGGRALGVAGAELRHFPHFASSRLLHFAPPQFYLSRRHQSTCHLHTCLSVASLSVRQINHLGPSPMLDVGYKPDPLGCMVQTKTDPDALKAGSLGRNVATGCGCVGRTLVSETFVAFCATSCSRGRSTSVSEHCVALGHICSADVEIEQSAT